MIPRADAIKIIDSGEVCSIEAVTYDRIRKTGGKLAYHPNVQKILQPDVVKTYEPKETFSKNGKKHPKHSENATRNLRRLDGSTFKIHIHLITLINGEEVVW